MGKVIRNTPTAFVGTVVDNGILFGGVGGTLKELKDVTSGLGGTALLKSISIQTTVAANSPELDIFFFKKSGDLGTLGSVPTASLTAAAITDSEYLGKVHFDAVDVNESIFISEALNNEMYISVKNNVDLVVEADENSQSIHYIAIARESVVVGAGGDFQVIFSFE